MPVVTTAFAKTMNCVPIPALSPTALDGLSEASRTSIERLAVHFIGAKLPDLTTYPRSRLAAVLVLLYEQDGDLRVLLTTRSKALWTHAGQTALPGGKVDDDDKDLVKTAFREAHEEVKLPLKCPFIHTIGLFEPFLSLHKLLVTPVLAILTRIEVLNELQPSEGEVQRIFSHPLKAILDPQLAQHEALVEIGSEDWPYQDTFYSTSDPVIAMLGDTSYRMHRFRTMASPIKGLTSDILIKTAEIAFGKETVYDRFAPDQIKGFQNIIAASDDSLGLL